VSAVKGVRTSIDQYCYMSHREGRSQKMCTTCEQQYPTPVLTVPALWYIHKLLKN